MSEGKSGTAAGLLLAISLVAGAAIGAACGQPSIGLLSGLAVGSALALISVLLARRR